MPAYRIALMPGDGIGPEVMDAAMIVLEKLKFDAEYVKGDIGWRFWCSEGNALPDRTVDLLKTCDCALFGAITSKPKDEATNELDDKLKARGFSYRSPIVTLRQMFDLYINLRPCKAFPGNPLNYRDDIDLVVFRENTEGLYSGVELHPFPDEIRSVITKYNPAMERFKEVPSSEIAVSLRVITEAGARRIIQKAFEYARKFKYKTVTLVEKPNVLRETSGMMRREARLLAASYPDIELLESNIDAQMMWLVKNPNEFGVIVTSNMFGDIVSDLSAQLVGGLGFAASGNIGDKFAVFEPCHGSAPKHEGKAEANPTAMILACSLMMSWLGEYEKAIIIEKAVANVIAEGKVLTYDMGGQSSTFEMAKAIANNL